MTRTRRIAQLTLITLAAIAAAAFAPPLLVPVAASSADIPFSRGDLDAASSALPTLAQPTISDETADIARTSRPDAHATAVSTASTNCDGCHGDAFTLQVIYLDGRAGKTADNVATAWSQCTNCSSSAISIQVVVARNSSQVTVNNRSLALNSACAQCTTRSAAVQYVLIGGPGHELSALSQRRIAELRTTLSDALRGAPSTGVASQTRAKTSVAPIADELEAILVAETGATSARHSIDIQIGS